MVVTSVCVFISITPRIDVSEVDIYPAEASFSKKILSEFAFDLKSLGRLKFWKDGLDSSCQTGGHTLLSNLLKETKRVLKGCKRVHLFLFLFFRLFDSDPEQT